MGQISWKTIFQPGWNPGGLKSVVAATTSRLFDDFESYADSAALQAIWTTTNVTRTLEIASSLQGDKSLKGIVTNAANQIKRTLNSAIYQFPFPKRLRYVSFKTTVDSGTAIFTVKFWDSADETNNYIEWSISPSDQFTDIVIDLNPDNSEGFPAPSNTGASYDPTTINRFSFEDLTNGRTYYFDDITFYYSYSLVDLVGFGTEPPVAIGVDGSIQARLNSIHADVKGLEGQTQQYAKQGIAVAEIGQALQWALELNSDFAPPTITEISPGTYDIDRVRLGVTTNIVDDAVASESTGTIYATYTPSETNFNIGDLVKVTFSDGFIRTDEEPLVLLTATTGAGGTTVTVSNAYAFQVGWLVKIVDDDTDAEWHTIASIDSPTTFTIDATTGAFTVAQNATITRSIQTNLSTAVFFTMLQATAQDFKILGTGTFTTSSATVPADTGRTEGDNYWNGSWLMPITGSAVNQPGLIVDFANGGIFTIDGEQPFNAATGLVEYIILGTRSQLVPAADSSYNQTPAHVIGNKSDVASVTAGNASIIARIRAIEVALSINAAAGGEFEIDGVPDLWDSLVVDSSSQADIISMTGNRDGAIIERLSAIENALNITNVGTGSGLEEDGTPNIVTALGTDGSNVTDSATSVLGISGANNNNNAFNSSSVIANSNGSILERLEHILVALGGTTGITSALGTSSTAIDTVARTENDNYWNGGIFVCIDGTNAGLARPIYDFVNVTGTIYFEPAFPNAVAAGVNYLILTRFDVARILGDNSADNSFDSSNVVANEDGSIIEREEDIARKLDVPAQDAATNVVERDVIGNKTDTIPAMTAAPGNDSIVRHAKAILERIGATPADPDDSVLTNLGQRDDTATLDDLSDITSTSIQAKLRRLLLRFSSDAFAATIQGASRTDIESMLGQLATYFSSGGAAWSVQINNQVARTNLEQVIEDLATVIGVDGINEFNPSIGGTARTNIDAAFAAIGTAVGAEYDGTPDLYDVTVTGYDSTGIAENRDGSVLERLEYAFGEIEDDSDSIQARIGNITGRTNDGNVAAALGLDLLPDVASGDLYTLLWKYLCNTTISSPTTKTGLQHLQAIGSDDANNDFASTNVVANKDGSVLERLEAILNGIIIGTGTFTTSSATVPADTGQSAMPTGQFDDCLLIPLTGVCALQPRLIVTFTTTTGVFTLDAAEAFTAAPGLVTYIIVAGKYNLNKTRAAYLDLLAGLGILNENGGTITTDGTEQTIWTIDTPTGIFSPKFFKIDFTNHTATESITVRFYYRIKSGGNYILDSSKTIQLTLAVAANLLSNTTLEDNRFGIKITIEKTAGTNRAYDWEMFYED